MTLLASTRSYGSGRFFIFLGPYAKSSIAICRLAMVPHILSLYALTARHTCLISITKELSKSPRLLVIVRYHNMVN